MDLRPPELPAFKALLLRWPTWLSYAVSMAVSELAPQPVVFYAAVFFLVNATYIFLIWELIDGSIVQQHGGALTYASRPEGGTIATINLPVRDAQPPFRL